MKTKPLSRRQRRRIVTVISIAFCLTVGANVRSRFLYPIANEIIDPKTGKYDQKLEALLDEYVKINHLANVVEIDLGNRSGGLGSEDDSKYCLYLLSPILRMNPTAQRFIIIWRYRGSTAWSEHIIYDRTDGTLSGSQSDSIGINEKIFATSVSDRTIHTAAQHYLSYRHLKNY